MSLCNVCIFHTPYTYNLWDWYWLKVPYLELHWSVEINMYRDESGGGGGWGETLQYQMDTGVRLTLPQAGAFGESTVSKNKGSLGEKPNFGSQLGDIGWECYFWSFSERFESRNLRKIVENGKNYLSYGGSLGESDQRAHISPKNVGSLGDRRDNQQNMGSMGDSSAENRGSLEPYVRVTSIMGVPPGWGWGEDYMFVCVGGLRYKVVEYEYERGPAESVVHGPQMSSLRHCTWWALTFSWPHLGFSVLHNLSSVAYHQWILWADHVWLIKCSFCLW